MSMARRSSRGTTRRHVGPELDEAHARAVAVAPRGHDGRGQAHGRKSRSAPSDCGDDALDVWRNGGRSTLTLRRRPGPPRMERATRPLMNPCPRASRRPRRRQPCGTGRTVPRCPLRRRGHRCCARRPSAGVSRARGAGPPSPPGATHDDVCATGCTAPGRRVASAQEPLTGRAGVKGSAGRR